MAFQGWPVWIAVLIALGAGAAAGLANGVAVAYVGIPSFVATLAIGSIAAAIELAITKTSIFEGIPESYLEIATTVATIPLRAVIAFGVVLLFLVLLRATVFGRHASSVGDNPAAALLTGVPLGARSRGGVRAHRAHGRPRGSPRHLLGGLSTTPTSAPATCCRRTPRPSSGSRSAAGSASTCSGATSASCCSAWSRPA